MIGEAGRALAGLVVDVGADVGAVGIAGIDGERALDVGERAIDPARLHLGEGQRAQVPPVLAVGGRERLEQRQQLLLSPRAAGEADEAEHAGAGREHHGIARILGQMLLDGGETRDAAAVDAGRERIDVALLAVRQALGQLPGALGGGPGVGGTVLHLQGARQRHVRHGQALVAGDGAAEGCLRVVVGGEREVDALDVGVARSGRGRGQGVAVAILEHGRSFACSPGRRRDGAQRRRAGLGVLRWRKAALWRRERERWRRF